MLPTNNNKERKMIATRYNPYNDLDIKKGFEVINTILNTLEGNKEDSPIASFTPRVNTRESDDAYYIELDLPGVKKDDIEITTEDNILTISGERKFKDEVKEENYYKVESHYGKYSRSFTLPENIDISAINAKNENGVLEVTIPKKDDENKKLRKIEIK
jgi:HSP20 family protein